MAIMLPRSGTGIMLRDMADAVYPSRIEAVDREVITVVKPMAVPAAFPYPLGSPFDVLWTDTAGQHVLPAELTTSRSEGTVRLWELKPVAQPWVEQRREYVRVPAFGRVTVVVADEEPEGPPTVLHGYLVDVSEAAMQCSLWAEPDDPALVASRPLVVDFAARGVALSRHGVIFGARRGGQDNEMTVVIKFHQTAAEATELRREVFATQVDLRQAWRRQREVAPEA